MYNSTKTDAEIQKTAQKVLQKAERRLKKKKAKKRLERNCKLFGEKPPVDVWEKRRKEMPGNRYKNQDEYKLAQQERKRKRAIKILSPHEGEIKRLMRLFYTNKEIAEKLGLNANNGSNLMSFYLKENELQEKRYIAKKSMSTVMRRAREIIELSKEGNNLDEITDVIIERHKELKEKNNRAAVRNRIKKVIKNYTEIPNFESAVKQRKDFFY